MACCASKPALGGTARRESDIWLGARAQISSSSFDRNGERSSLAPSRISGQAAERADPKGYSEGFLYAEWHCDLWRSHPTAVQSAATTKLHQEQRLTHLSSRRSMSQLRLASSARCGKRVPVVASIVRKPYYRETMRVFGRMGVLALMLVSCLTPAMACLVPGRQMTVEERACCRAMGSQCGAPGMPASHSCCQGTLPDLHEKMIETKTTAVCPFAVAVVHLTALAAGNPSPSIHARVGYADSSPQGSPPSSVSILRI